MTYTLEHPPIIRCTCPSCGAISEFTLQGIQQWPPHVAQAANLPETIGLYACEHCQTTISEIELTESAA